MTFKHYNKFILIVDIVNQRNKLVVQLKLKVRHSMKHHHDKKCRRHTPHNSLNGLNTNSSRLYEHSEGSSLKETMIKHQRGLGWTKPGESSSLSPPRDHYNPAFPIHMYSTYSQKAQSDDKGISMWMSVWSLGRNVLNVFEVFSSRWLSVRGERPLGD